MKTTVIARSGIPRPSLRGARQLIQWRATKQSQGSGQAPRSQRLLRVLRTLAMTVGFSTMILFVLRAEEAKLTVDGAPMRYTFVDGDSHKFREQNWMKENYAGGVDEFNIEGKNLPENISVSMEGHAIVEDNDYETNFRVEKKDFGYVLFEYQEFSKFYDDSGGVYEPFGAFRAPTLNRELELEIGHLRIETGMTLPDIPQIAVAYERHFKDGSKSRLTWASVIQNGIARAIAPSFQDIDEIVDSVELKESHTLKGFEIQAEQGWEWMSSEMMREERSLSTTGTAADRKIRDQVQQPKSRIFTTTESVGRWFRNETLFTGVAYHYLNLENSEVENMFEMNENRGITNFTNPKQIRNARADNEYDAHTWTANFMMTPLSWLNITTHLRSEIIGRSGDSIYPSDSTPVAAAGAAPDNVINTTEISHADDKVRSIGEGLSLRFTAIPRTALYNDFEFEQVRNWLSEDRNSRAGQSAANANEIFGRETITYISRGIWTIGGQCVPVYWATLTAHFRFNQNNSDYEDERETQPGATAAKSAFFDALNIQTHELATHLTLKPKPWLRPSVRYRYQIRDYMSSVENQGEVETEMDSHIFTFDTSVQPRSNLLIIGGFSPQYAWVESPLASEHPGDGGPPRFQANIYTWFLNLEYDFNDRLSFLSSLEHSITDNFNDFTTSGLMLGVGYNQVNVSFGFNWKINQTVSIRSDYSFLHYAADDSVDLSDYNANMIGLKTKVEWA